MKKEDAIDVESWDLGWEGKWQFYVDRDFLELGSSGGIYAIFSRFYLLTKWTNTQVFQRQMVETKSWAWVFSVSFSLRFRLAQAHTSALPEDFPDWKK